MRTFLGVNVIHIHIGGTGLSRVKRRHEMLSTGLDIKRRGRKIARRPGTVMLPRAGTAPCYSSAAELLEIILFFQCVSLSEATRSCTSIERSNDAQPRGQPCPDSL